MGDGGHRLGEVGVEARMVYLIIYIGAEIARDGAVLVGVIAMSLIHWFLSFYLV
jgi:hypothetical protein